MRLKNVKLKNQDITKGITKKNIDLIILDMPEPQKALKKVLKGLKQGGYIIGYVPSITQVISLVKETTKIKELMLIKTIENIQREWKIEEKIARPEFRMLGHTGFIVVIRKIN